MTESRAADIQADPLVGSLVAGRYRVQRKLTQGGMGVVYEAMQEPLGRRVALKVIRGDADDELARQRFEREAKAASALQDPHVVVVHDFGVLDGAGGGRAGLYLAMEFLDGDTLRQRLQRGRLSFAQSCAVVRQIALGLAHAHERGLVHRDLKPENVILVDTNRGEHAGRDVRVKVLDFGLAKGTAASSALLAPTDQPLTRSGGFVGTPGYIGPEVIDGKADDPRQDIYALGVVWWELVTGRHPFPAETPMKTLLRQMHEEPPDLDELTRAQTGIPDAGVALIRTMMARDPGARPRDGHDLLARLDDLDRQIGVSDTRIDTAAPSVDSNAETLAGRRGTISAVSAPLASHAGGVDQAADGAATVEARRRPAELAPASAPDTPLTSSTAQPAPVAPSVAPTSLSSGRRRRLRSRERSLGAIALASVLGTVGGVVALRVIEHAPAVVEDLPAPLPEPPPALTPAPAAPVIVVTDLHLDGVPNFVTLKRLRDALPPHALRVYRQGRAELIFQGDLSGSLADTLSAIDIAVDDAQWHVEVTEIVDGRLTATIAPGPPGEADEAPPELPDAGLIAPGGLAP